MDVEGSADDILQQLEDIFYAEGIKRHRNLDKFLDEFKDNLLDFLEDYKKENQL